MVLSLSSNCLSLRSLHKPQNFYFIKNHREMPNCNGYVCFILSLCIHMMKNNLQEDVEYIYHGHSPPKLGFIIMTQFLSMFNIVWYYQLKRHIDHAPWMDRIALYRSAYLDCSTKGWFSRCSVFLKHGWNGFQQYL